jgi:hypothetical protein
MSLSDLIDEAGAVRRLVQQGDGLNGSAAVYRVIGDLK